MSESYVVCVECGGDTHTEGIDDERGEIQKVVCNHCSAEGRLIAFGGMNPTKKVQDGPFAELTAEGMLTLRDNLGFTPVYEQ
jgi:hypothetical protein